MNAQVTITFAGGVASTNLVQIFLTGASLGLLANAGQSTMFPLPNLVLGAGHVSISTMQGGVFTGRIELLLAGSAQSMPVVTLNNLVPGPQGEPTTIRWPTQQGLQTQVLTPGDPLTLNGITWS